MQGTRQAKAQGRLVGGALGGKRAGKQVEGSTKRPSEPQSSRRHLSHFNTRVRQTSIQIPRFENISHLMKRNVEGRLIPGGNITAGLSTRRDIQRGSEEGGGRRV